MHRKNILLLGDGDGRFAAAFLQSKRAAANQTAHLDFVDCSAGMVRLAKKRIQKMGLHASAVQFRPDDARVAPFRGPYDLVVSHFFLDCFSTLELRGMIPRIAAATTPDAKWLVSEFAIPPRGLWKNAGRLAIHFMYLFFRFTTGLAQAELPDHSGALAASGFQLIKLETAMRGLLISELWSKRSIEYSSLSRHG